jgi:hypothetical protein
MDFGLANPAFEFAGTLLRMLLSGGGVVHPATVAGKLLGSPYAACHDGNLTSTAARFKSAAFQ